MRLLCFCTFYLIHLFLVSLFSFLSKIIFCYYLYFKIYFYHMNTASDLRFVWVLILRSVLFFFFKKKTRYHQYNNTYVIVWLRPETKAPRGHPSPRWGTEENRKKQAETGGSGYRQFNRTAKGTVTTMIQTRRIHNRNSRNGQSHSHHLWWQRFLSLE